MHALKWKEVKFILAKENQSAFESLIKALSDAPFLQGSNFEMEFILVTDASDLAISAMLNLRVGNDLAPVSYYSRLLSLLNVVILRTRRNAMLLYWL